VGADGFEPPTYAL